MRILGFKVQSKLVAFFRPRFKVNFYCQSLPLGVPDDRLKLRVTIDQKFRDNVRRSQGISVCQSQLTPPAKVREENSFLTLKVKFLKVPSSPTCSSPERGSEQDSLYDSGYCKQYSRVQDWGQFQSYQDRYYQQAYNQVSYTTYTTITDRVCCRWARCIQATPACWMPEVRRGSSLWRTSRRWWLWRLNPSQSPQTPTAWQTWMVSQTSCPYRQVRMLMIISTDSLITALCFLVLSPLCHHKKLITQVSNYRNILWNQVKPC